MVASEGLAWDPLPQIVITLVVTGILEDPKPYMGHWSFLSEVSLSSLATRTRGQEAPNAARKRQEQNLTLMAQETRLLVSRPPRPSVFRA